MTSATNYSQLQNRRIVVILEITLLVIAPLAAAIVWWYWGGHEAWDDAFISYRYALNLSEGRGLVWNPGGEPTQGYTNLLFVVLTAAALKIGLDPVIWAYALNTLGLIVTGLSFWLLARRLMPTLPLLPALVALVVALMPLSLQNNITGLETIFWSGLVFTTSALVVADRYAPRHTTLIAAMTLAFLACLTRPESILFAACWTALLIWNRPSGARRPVVIAALAAALLGIGYIVWLQAYFGDILPNSFYIKVNNSETTDFGLTYVRDYLSSLTEQPLFYAGLLGLPLLHRYWRDLLAYVVTLLLLAFYPFTTPLMGEYFRFLYPAAASITFILTAGVILLALIILDRVVPNALDNLSRGHELRFSLRLGLTSLILLPVLAYVLAYPTFSATWEHVRLGRSTNIPPHNVTRTAKLLANIAGIEQITIAYGDAGKMSYYTNSQFLDVVGLNNNTIAHHASDNGPIWVIDYVLGQQPDLIGFYAYDGGKIFTTPYGGVIGAAYPDLYRDPRFQKAYKHVAGFNYQYGLYCHWFVRNDSAFANTLTSTLADAGDITGGLLTP
jgi:hypothetical protein